MSVLDVTTTKRQGTANSYAVNLPASVVDGQLMVLAMAVGYSSTNIVAPTGWTPILQGGANASHVLLYVFYRNASSDAGGTVTVENGGGSNFHLTASVVRFSETYVGGSNSKITTLRTSNDLTPATDGTITASGSPTIYFHLGGLSLKADGDNSRARDVTVNNPTDMVEIVDEWDGNTGLPSQLHFVGRYTASAGVGNIAWTIEDLSSKYPFPATQENSWQAGHAILGLAPGPSAAPPSRGRFRYSLLRVSTNPNLRLVPSAGSMRGAAGAGVAAVGVGGSAPPQNITNAPDLTVPPVSDHGLLTGLGDDDHTQYLNTVRHDSDPHLAVRMDQLAGQLLVPDSGSPKVPMTNEAETEWIYED